MVPSGSAPVELEADDFGDQHGDGLAQHGGFRLDAADAPAQHGQAVDHGGVRVGADQRVGIGIGDLLALHLLLAGPHGAGEIFEIHLMADAGAGRHDAEIVEGALAPLEKSVALAVAVVFEIDVGLEGLRTGEEVHHHRVVDDEIDRRQRIDLLRILAQALHRVAHRGEIDHGGHAGEVLHQHAGRAEGDLLLVPAAVLEPAGDARDIVLGDRAAVLEAQQVLQQHLQRIGQLRNALEAVLLGGLQAEIGIGLRTDLEGLLGLEAVEGHRGLMMLGIWREPIVSFALQHQCNLGRKRPFSRAPACRPPAAFHPVAAACRDTCALSENWARGQPQRAGRAAPGSGRGHRSWPQASRERLPLPG